MQKCIKHSIGYANQKNYLDKLFQVYPTIPEGIRCIDSKQWAKVKEAFDKRNDILLIKSLLSLDLFPVKDSYIAYLRRVKIRSKETLKLLIALQE